MSSQVRRFVVAVAAGILIAPATGWAATGAAKVNPGAAARSCADGRGLTARLGARDWGYLARFVPCVLRSERQQLGLSYVQSAAASRLARPALAHLMTLPYVTRHQPVAAGRAELRAAKNIATKMCEREGFYRASYQVSLGDTAPPRGLTPIAVARGVAVLFTFPNPVARMPRAVWAVAVEPGLVFEKGNPNGVSNLIVDFACP